MLAVIAGTPVDTAFGLALAKSIHQEILGIAISQNPEEQTVFQVLPEVDKKAHLTAVLKDCQAKGVTQVLVYCNSLSSSVDFDQLSRDLSLDILTPLHFYRDLALSYQTMGLLAANAQGSAGIERAITLTNPQSRVHAISSLDWVEAIEQKIPAQEMVDQMGLKETIRLFETLKVEAIVFGCTHFPYFLAAYQEETHLPCVSADAYFVEKLSQQR